MLDSSFCREELVLTEKYMEFQIVLRMTGAALLGGGAGFLYHKVVGCRTGACPITANPWISTLYGAFVGLLITYR